MAKRLTKTVGTTPPERQRAAPVPLVKFVPKRGRPSAEQVAAIDRAILAGARRIFLNEGYDALAMEKLADVVGVSKGTLYARHPSKESLLQAVIQNSIEDWAAAVAIDESLLSNDIVTRIRYHARGIARTLNEPDVGALHRLMIATRHRFPETWRTLYDIGYLQAVKTIASEITAAAARDGIPVRDAEGCARGLVGMISGWHLQESMVTAISLQEAEAIADRAAELIIAARSSW